MLARVAVSPNQGHHAAQPLPRHLGGRIRRVVAVFADLNEDAATVAVSFAPARVRVQHDTLIRASRAAVWEVLQKLTPADQWKDVSVVLATLEAIYGVEYQGLAEQLLTAFQEANKVQSLLDISGDRTTSSGSIIDEPLVPERLQALQLEHLVQSGLSQLQQPGQPAAPAGNTSKQDTISRPAKDSSSSHASHRHITRHSAGSDQQLAMAEAAATATAAADQAFMQLLLLLAYKAAFVSLSERDVQLGVSLNTEFLWQLFVKVNTKQLDRQLVAPGGSHLATHTASSSSSSNGHQASSSGSSVLGDLDSLLVLRRGYGSEKQRGRWLLQKFDYVQLLLVKKAIRGIAALSSRVMQKAKAAVEDLGRRQQPQQQQQQHQQPQQEQQKDGQRYSRVADYSGKDPSSQQGQVVQQQQAVQSRANTMDQQPVEAKQRRNRAPSDQLLLKQKLWQEQQRVKEQRRQQAKQQQQRHRQKQQNLQQPYSQQVLSSIQEQGPAAAVNSQVDQLAGVAAALAAVASSPQLKSGTDVDFDESVAFLEQSGSKLTTVPEAAAAAADDPSLSPNLPPTPDPIGSHELLPPSPPPTSSNDNHWQGSEKPTGDDVGHAPPLLLPQLPQLQQRSSRQSRQRGNILLRRLTTRIQQSINSMAHSLSDWGIIPRMDVTPLEMFDQVFPLTEPGRFRPLFIEKATLPDVLDPVIQPRLEWMLGKGQRHNSPADGSSNGSSSSSGSTASRNAAAESAAGMDNSPGGGSSPVVQSFWQPIELVTPTFLQLLVVYRKKPRPERWRQWRVLRDKVLGRPQQQQQEEAVRRRASPIRLQVYRDIPLPSWQVVFPDKLLQFRPLDLLRLDLFGLFGVGAALFQARYNNFYLELLTLVSLSVWGTRLVLGYMRMGDRYKSIVAQLLAERTVAGGEGALEYLATAAGLQQFKQTALAYVLLLEAGQALEVEELAAAVEQVLQDQLQLQVRFGAAEALSELHRFGLLDKVQDGGNSNNRSSSNSGGGNVTGDMVNAVAAAAGAAAFHWQGKFGTGGGPAPVTPLDLQAGAAVGEAGASLLAVEQQRQLMPEVVAKVAQNGSNGRNSEQQHQQLLYSVCGGASAQQVLQQYWASLLQQRVDSILRVQSRG